VALWLAEVAQECSARTVQQEEVVQAHRDCVTVRIDLLALGDERFLRGELIRGLEFAVGRARVVSKDVPMNVVAELMASQE
jgi:hypothetical protein